MMRYTSLLLLVTISGSPIRTDAFSVPTSAPTATADNSAIMRRQFLSVATVLVGASPALAAVDDLAMPTADEQAQQEKVRGFYLDELNPL